MFRYAVVLVVALAASHAWAETPSDCQPLDVYMRSAKIYMGAQQKIPDFKSAQKQLDKAIECYPAAVEARFLLAKIMWNKRLLPEFLELAKALDTLDKQRQFMDTVWQMRRAAWADLFTKGVDSLKRSNQTDSLRGAAHQEGNTAAYDSLTNVGRRYLESAKGLMLAALEMDSARSEPYQNLGVIDVRLQNWSDALTWYRKSLETKPDDPDLMRNMVSLNLRQNENDSARLYIDKLLAVNPDDLEQLTNLAGLYSSQGHGDSANLVFKRIIEKDPENKNVLFNLGVAAEQSAQAETEKIKRYATDANTLTGEYNKLAAGGASKQLDEVKRKRDDAIKSLQESKATSKESWAQASGMFSKLSHLDPADYEARYHWGVALFWQEKYDSALVPLADAVALKPDYCDAWQVYFFSAARANKGDLATEAKSKFEACGK